MEHTPAVGGDTATVGADTATVGADTETVEAYKPGQTVLLINEEGFPIHCENCGEHAVMRSPKARFCSEECRFEHHGNAKPRRKAKAYHPTLF